jgi:hypothetical protein
LSLVRPDRISSPMTTIAAVTISAIGRKLREGTTCRYRRHANSAMGVEL